MNKVFLYVISSFFLLISMQSIVNAGMGVDPAILEIIVSQEETNKGCFRVFNDGNKPLDVVVYPEKWINESIDFDKWLKLYPVQFTVNGMEHKRVDYEINVPSGAIGELMCMVFFVAVEKGEGASPIGIKFGVPIYAVVKGTGDLKGKIEKIDVKYNAEKHMLSGEILVDNQSNVHIRPDVEITILDDKGVKVESFEIPYKQPVQRQQKRPIMFQKEIKLEQGKFKIKIKADCGKLYNVDKVFEGETDFFIGESYKVGSVAESESSALETKNVLQELSVQESKI